MNRSTRNRAPKLLFCASILLAGLVGCQSTTDVQASKDWFEGGSMRTASADTMQLTARILASKGKTAQAGFILDRMAREYPNDVATYSEGAEVLMIEGRITDAIAWLGKGLERLPNNPILLNNRGMCHLIGGNLPLATADFEAAHAADKADADFIGNLALARALAGDETEARRLWEQVLSRPDIEENLKLARNAQAKFAAAQ